MKQKLILIPLAGGILSLLSIFLPWVKFDWPLMPYADRTAKTIIYSGFEICRFQTDRFFFVTLAFIAALAIFGAIHLHIESRNALENQNAATN